MIDRVYPMFTAQVANYFGHGNTRTDYEDGGWSWNVLSCRLARYRVRIIQNRDILSHRLKPGGFVPTSQIEIDGVKRFSEGETVVNDICRLLAFAAMSQVVPFEYRMGGKKRGISITGRSWWYRPVIDIKNGDLTAAYLEKIWNTYRIEKHRRKLGEVIEMLTIAELPSQPLEIQLAQIFIIMENLKSTYARARGYPFVDGFFRKISRPPKLNPGKEPTLGFERLLKEMLSGVGMKPRLRRVVQLRNEIIHFGLSRRPLGSLRKHYETCQDIVREYLLRFLGYDGEYLIYNQACRASKVLPRIRETGLRS
jgi:hypothetical protein